MFQYQYNNNNTKTDMNFTDIENNQSICILFANRICKMNASKCKMCTNQSKISLHHSFDSLLFIHLFIHWIVCPFFFRESSISLCLIETFNIYLLKCAYFAHSDDFLSYHLCVCVSRVLFHTQPTNATRRM